MSLMQVVQLLWHGEHEPSACLKKPDLHTEQDEGSFELH